MRRKFLKRGGNAIQERCVKGMRKIQRLIDEANEHNPFDISDDNNERKHDPFAVSDFYQSNPFIETDEWDGLSEDEQSMVGAYLEIFDAEDTLSETLDAARERYRGQFDSWADWAEEEYESGIITAEDLAENGCIDWERAGDTFNDSYEMADNGMVFCSTY